MIITQSPSLESIQDLNFRLHIQTYITKTLATDKKKYYFKVNSTIFDLKMQSKKWKVSHFWKSNMRWICVKKIEAVDFLKLYLIFVSSFQRFSNRHKNKLKAMSFILKFRHSEKAKKIWNNLPQDLKFTK